GLGDDHEGIIEIDSSVELGTAVAELFSLNDTVLELGITPNRSECFGYIGVARDLASKLGIPLRTPGLESLQLEDSIKTSNYVTVKVDNDIDCPRFCALYVDQVSTLASPAWIQSRLSAAGMRPINIIVDATNYAMLEYSQPIHAYDSRDI